MSKSFYYVLTNSNHILYKATQTGLLLLPLLHTGLPVCMNVVNHFHDKWGRKTTVFGLKDLEPHGRRRPGPSMHEEETGRNRRTVV